MIAVRRSSLLATILVPTVSAFAAASDELARANDLYGSAPYDDALLLKAATSWKYEPASR